MDLDKIKKAAGKTIKVISGKTDDFTSELKNSNNIEIDDDLLFDDFSDEPLFAAPEKSQPIEEAYTEADDGATQKFNLQNMLERFRQKKDDIDSTFRSILDITDKSSDNSSEQADVSAEYTKKAVESPTAQKKAVDTHSMNSEISELDSQIYELKKSIDELSEFTGTAVEKINKTVDKINGNFNITEQKLTEISNSLASISKLNDSIFDLKNAQMNTKNSLADLEVAFGKLKKKMSASITIISVLAAIIAILEIINLLS